MKSLNHPYVFPVNLKGRSATFFAFTVYIYTGLYFISNMGNNHLRLNFNIHVAVFGSVLLMGLLLFNALLFKYQSHYFNEDVWTVQRELKWIFFNLIAVNFFTAVFALGVERTSSSAFDLLKFEFVILIIGGIPMVLRVFYNEAKWRNLFHKNAEKLNAKLNSFSSLSRINAIENLNTVLIESDHAIKLQLNDVVYIHSDHSGFELCTNQSNELANIYIQSDLKSLRTNILAYKKLLQCHPSFIVNINKVIHVTGNARGYKLHMKSTTTQVPVSTQYQKAFERMIV